MCLKYIVRNYLDLIANQRCISKLERKVFNLPSFFFSRHSLYFSLLFSFVAAYPKKHSQPLFSFLLAVHNHTLSFIYLFILGL